MLFHIERTTVARRPGLTVRGELDLATAPQLAVLMLGDLGFAPWQYALAFGAPCVGGLVGARLSPRLTAR